MEKTSIELEQEKPQKQESKYVESDSDSDDNNEADQSNPKFDDWIEDDEEIVRIKSLFDSHYLNSVKALLEYDSKTYQFNLQEIVYEICHDEIDFIKLINFLRKTIQTNQTINNAELTQLVLNKQFLQDDTNMIPVLEDDPLLFLFEEYFSFGPTEEES